jgi:nitrogen fixation protein NifU and related proteins
MQKIEGATEYNEIVLRHFQSPSNVGVIEEPDGVGEYASDICGDLIRFYLKLNGDRITDVKFQCFGCVGSVACSSILTEIILGKDIETANSIKESHVLKTLGGLPEEKIHCANLAIGALQQAIVNYLEKRVQQ